MNAANFPNKTIEDLQKEKLQSEIRLLNAQFEIDFPKKKKNIFNKIAGFFKKWYAAIIAICTLIASIWGIFYPIKSYFDEKSKELDYTLNNSMISLTSDLASTDPQKRMKSVMMLSYYEENSIKILLYFLERTDDENFSDQITEALKNIYRDHGKEIIEMALVSFESNYEGFKQNQDVNGDHYGALLNFMSMFNRMNLDKKDHQKVLKYLTSVKSDINCDCNSLDATFPALQDKICAFEDKLN